MPKIGCNRPPRTEYEVALPQSESSRAGDTISPNCSSKDDTFRVIKRAEEHFYELVPRLLQFTENERSAHQHDAHTCILLLPIANSASGDRYIR